jgi:hypothetical protein
MATRKQQRLIGELIKVLEENGAMTWNEGSPVLVSVLFSIASDTGVMKDFAQRVEALLDQVAFAGSEICHRRHTLPGLR